MSSPAADDIGMDSLTGMGPAADTPNTMQDPVCPAQLRKRTRTKAIGSLPYSGGATHPDRPHRGRPPVAMARGGGVLGGPGWVGDHRWRGCPGARPTAPRVSDPVRPVDQILLGHPDCTVEVVPRSESIWYRRE